MYALRNDISLLCSEETWISISKLWCYTIQTCTFMTGARKNGNIPGFRYIFVDFTGVCIIVSSCMFCGMSQINVNSLDLHSFIYSFLWNIVIFTWISNYMPSKVWDEITYPFSNFNGCTVEVWEWISHFIPHFTWHVIIHPCQNRDPGIRVTSRQQTTTFFKCQISIDAVDDISSHDFHVLLILLTLAGHAIWLVISLKTFRDCSYVF